jgi:hypothetical protein
MICFFIVLIITVPSNRMKSNELQNIRNQELWRFQSRHMSDTGILNDLSTGNFPGHQLAGLYKEIVLLAIDDEYRTANSA